jgi:hypothetical protein
MACNSTHKHGASPPARASPRTSYAGSLAANMAIIPSLTLLAVTAILPSPPFLLSLNRIAVEPRSILFARTLVRISTTKA